MWISLRKLLALSIIFTLSYGTSFASPVSLDDIDHSPSCEQTLNACDEALEAARETISFQDAAIKKQTELLTKKNKRIADLESQDNTLEIVLYTALGVAIGGLVVGVATK